MKFVASESLAIVSCGEDAEARKFILHELPSKVLHPWQGLSTLVSAGISVPNLHYYTDNYVFLHCRCKAYCCMLIRK